MMGFFQIYWMQEGREKTHWKYWNREEYYLYLKYLARRKKKDPSSIISTSPVVIYFLKSLYYTIGLEPEGH